MKEEIYYGVVLDVREYTILTKGVEENYRTCISIIIKTEKGTRQSFRNGKFYSGDWFEVIKGDTVVIKIKDDIQADLRIIDTSYNDIIV